MAPSKNVNGISEELTFFDRVKKFLADKKSYNEFLKLCNLFSQALIDKNTLFHKAHSFIGSNTELTTWFKNFIQYDGRDEIIENKPKIPGDKVVLSNCRGLGPSYRLLPKRERLRPCGGRDEMCRQVLNDEWVSHPTWASEDSGFIAHRKNNHEEALHRIEEERHDYDINIEACLRTIQLMEPIVQQMQMMTLAEKHAYVLPPGIGGQSETIYQRVIKKIYDREEGGRVIDDMFKRPHAVLPVLLARLKQKAEEWKLSQVSHVRHQGLCLISLKFLANDETSGNGKRSGANRPIRSFGRVWTTKELLQKRKTNVNFNLRRCRLRYKSSMRSNDDSALSPGKAYQTSSSRTISKISMSSLTPVI